MQTHHAVLAETLCLLFHLALFLFALGLLVGIVGVVILDVVLVVRVIVALVIFSTTALVVTLAAAFALELFLNRLVDSLRCLAQSDVGLLVGGVVLMRFESS